MNNEKELTPKQDSFCIHYTTIGADTFSNGTKAAIAAGYSKTSAYSQASALLKNPKIQQRRNELHSENMSRNFITIDKVLADLEHDKLLAREHHNYSVATRCTELQGKYLSMFTDKIQSEEKLSILDIMAIACKDKRPKPISSQDISQASQTEDQACQIKS